MADNATIIILFKANTSELSRLLLFKACNIKKREPKLASPSKVPSTIVGICNLDLLFRLLKIVITIPQRKAIKNTNDE